MTTRLAALVALIAMSAGCGASTSASTGPDPQPAPDPAPPPPDPVPPPTETPPPGPTGCAGPAPGAGYECVRDCGPPVVSSNDPPPGYSWMTAADARRREQYGCPVCLPGEARIATPGGERAVSSLRAGDAIWTLDLAGERVVGRVRHAGSTLFSGPHHVVRVTLADGRVGAASGGHRTATGALLSELGPGDALSGSVVVRTERTPMAGDRTFDVLPSGPTGAYWADGVVLRSSFWR